MTREGINTVALSFSPDTARETRIQLSRRALESLFGFGIRHIFRIALNQDTLVFTTCPPSQVAVARGSLTILHGRAIVTRSGDALLADDIAERFAASVTPDLDGLEPPFLVFSGNLSGATAITDPVGLVHLYSSRNGSCAGLATSAALLARTFKLPLSFDGVFQQMTVGHGLGEATVFSGISMVPPGARATLTGGQLALQELPSAALSSVTDFVGAGIQAISAAVGRCLSAVPDCGVELSGGMDSRMALAAIPRDLRKGRYAYTIGYPGAHDIDIAEKISRRFSMEHVVVDLSGFDRESPDETWRRASRVAYRDDFSTNVIDRLAIDCVDDILLESSRIGGVNGELARGFYYPMLPVHGPVTESALDALIGYRLCLNDAAPRDLFKEQECRDAAAGMRLLIARELRSYQQPLGGALDCFYLRQRMRRWAGAGISRAAMSRVILSPFFHREYIAWARGLPVDWKQDSIAFSSVLEVLDRELATLPLDSMLTPLQTSGRSLASGAARVRVKARKLSYKLAQKMGWAATSTVGSHQFVQKLSHPELLGRIDWNAFSKIGVFSDRGLERLRVGALPLARASLGPLLSIHFLLEYLNAPAFDAPVVSEVELA